MINFYKEIMEQINLFENYVTLFSSVGNDANDKQYIGNKENKVCRFCGKKENEVSFSEIAHAIPEAIGNKELILYEECNECNHFFSENIEVHFDKITKPYKNIGQIKGKNKIPSYKTKDKKSRIDVKDQVVLKQAVDSPIYVIDKKNKIMTITYEIEPFIPAAVYKTLVKMALSVMPNKDLIDFKQVYL